jgi:hypothetical protein
MAQCDRRWRLFLFAHLFFLFFLIPCALSAGTLVTCSVDCTTQPNVTAAVQQCLVDQATLCNVEVMVVPQALYEPLLGITNNSAVNVTFPDEFVWQPTNETVPRVSCDGLVPNPTYNGVVYSICVEVTFCYIDPDALVTVFLNGSCDATSLPAPGVGAIAFIGPAIIVGPGLLIPEDIATTIIFSNVTFNGGGTTEPLLANCFITSNLTLLDVNITGFNGDYVLKAEACDYDIWIELENVNMADVPGTAIYLEGIWSFILVNFLCERCAQRNNSECVHYLITPVSTGVVDIINANCFRVADLLPPRCRYCLTGDEGFCASRCNEGVVQEYDRLATEQFANCPVIQFSFIDYFTALLTTIPEFDPLCRVWTQPVCNFIAVANAQNITHITKFGGGDNVWFYDAPLICVPGGAINPDPGPFFLVEFDANLGDPVFISVLPPLPTPPAFVDPSFEQFGTNWTEAVALFAVVNADVISSTAPIPALTGIYDMRCDNDAVKSISQYVQASVAEVGVAQAFSFYGARRSGQQFRYAGRFVHLIIDNVVQDTLMEPTFSATMVADNTYYLFSLSWTPADTALHLLTLQCDFSGGANAVTFEMDDFSWPGGWGGSVLLDPSVEEHSLTWVDNPVGQVILPDAQTPCVPRTGDFVMQCGSQGLNQRANQMVTFTQDGVYAVQLNARRLNALVNYAGLQIEVVDGTTQLETVDIDATNFPNNNNYFALTGQGGIAISGAPVTLDLGFRCDFTTAVSPVDMCIDDVAIVAIGVVGIVPNTLGFSSQTISQAPFIVNQTCDCSNFTAPVRNETVFPCAYALDDDSICIETVPYCCFTPWMEDVVLLPYLLTPNTSCTDLNADPPCVWLLDCNVLTGGVVSTCREFTCPFNASLPSLPADSIGNAHDYILVNCTENVLTNWTDSLLFPTGVQFGGSGSLTFYVPQPPAGLLYIQQSTAYFQNCPQADDPTCLIYTGCDWPPDFNPVLQTYSITNCDQVNCTVPSGLPPSTQTQLAACTLISSGNTLSIVDGGWSFFADDSAVLFDETELLYQLNKLLETAFSTDFIEFFMLPANESVLAASCPDPKYFWLCPCANATGNYTVPVNSTNNDPSVVDDFYTCTDGVPTCRCNQAALDVSNPPPNGTIAFHHVVAPDTLSRYRVLDLRAQQYMYGEIIEQVSYELMATNTIAIPHFYDSRARCRLSIRNDNEFCRGSPAAGGADCYQGNINGPYSEACNILNIAGPGPALPCEMWYGQFFQITSESQFDCLVDDRATDDIPGFGTTIFVSVSDALAGCNKDVIGVRSTTKSAYYEENMQIQKTNKNIFLVTLPSDQAIIVGRHTIGTSADNVTLVGFHLIHPADNQQPLFDVDKQDDDSNLNTFTLLNTDLDGSGCRKCGVVDTKRLNVMVVNYTRLSNWQFFAIKLDDADRFVMGNNKMNGTQGRAILVKYRQGFIIDDLALIDTRGGQQLKGAALTSFTAKVDSACDESDVNHMCLFRLVVQHVITTPEVERFRDVCFYFARGKLLEHRIYDTLCRLAQNGMVFLKTMNVDSTSLVTLMQQNPLMRPNLFQLPLVQGSPTGTDYVLRGTIMQVSDGGDILFNFNEDVETNYDTFPFLLPFVGELRCQSNINWEERYGFGPGLGFVPEIPRMGVERFHNASIMVEFCQDRRMVPPLLGGMVAPAFIGRVRPFNGSALNPEILNVTRDAWLIGDDTDACCKLRRFYPTIQGVRHTLQTRRLNITDLRFTLPPEPVPPFDMWSSGPQVYSAEQLSAQQFQQQTLPNEVCLDYVVCDGREVLPSTGMWAFNLLVGEEVPPEFFTPTTNKPPPATQALVVVRNCTVKRFPAYNVDTAPDGFDFLPGDYPFSSGMRFQFFNRLSCTSTALVFNLTVQDVDATGLQIEFPNNITVMNSTFNNCSGRALGNTACVQLVGNDVSALIVGSKNFNATAYFLNTTAVMHFLNNTCLNTRTVLFPLDDHSSEPGYVSCYWLQGYPNTTDYCVLNGTADGLSIGIRQANTLNLTLLQCSLYTIVPPVVWPDRQRYLRAQCIAGSLFKMLGTTHHDGYGVGETDKFGETIWCDSDRYDPAFYCCPLLDPPGCFVVQTASLLQPGNPWLGRFIFADINDAIVNCNATTRVISVVGSTDPFLTGDTSQKTYTQVFSATVPVTALSGATGKLTIGATNGVFWESVGNRLATQCVPTVVQDFVFVDDSVPGVPIWDQTAPSDDSCGLRIFNNFFNLTVDTWAIRAEAGDFFSVDHNTVRGHSLTRNAIEVFGNGSCDDVGVRVSNTDMRDVLGGGLQMYNLNCFTMHKNKLNNVGGQDATTFTPYSLLAGVCATPRSGKCTEITHNIVHTTQIVSALVGRMATCWFDPVPRDVKSIYIFDNECEGLDFGQRYNNIPDNSPSGDPKALLRFYCVQWLNVLSKGQKLLPLSKRFDLVRGPPALDVSLITDPNSPSNVGRWCTDCCPRVNNWLIWALLIALGACLLCLCVLFAGSLFFNSRIPQDMGIAALHTFRQADPDAMPLVDVNALNIGTSRTVKAPTKTKPKAKNALQPLASTVRRRRAALASTDSALDALALQ